MNNKSRDQRFLKRCYRGDKKALDLWNVLSYWSEVVGAVKAVVSKETIGHVDIGFVQRLVVDCTDQIYRQWSQIPSWYFDLKTQVRKYAISYTKKYIQLGGSLTSKP